jgi:membrane-associated phospholipid phosphatase
VATDWRRNPAPLSKRSAANSRRRLLTGRRSFLPVTSVPLAPPWAATVALTALVTGSLLAAVVWHATRLGLVDAWILKWQEMAFTRAGELAAIVSATLRPAVILTMVAGAVLGWRARRWDLIVLALASLPATLAVEILLKQLVHRQWDGGPALIFPSGHAAMATAAALTVLLAVRIAPMAARARLAVACVGVGYALAVVLARLVETVHPLTDVLGGVATGLVVTLGVTLVLTAMSSSDAPDRAGAVRNR